MRLSSLSVALSKLNYKEFHRGNDYDAFYKDEHSFYKVVVNIYNFGRVSVVNEDNIHYLKQKIENGPYFVTKKPCEFLFVIRSRNKKDEVRLSEKNVVYFMKNNKAVYRNISNIFSEEIDALKIQRNIFEAEQDVIKNNDRHHNKAQVTPVVTYGIAIISIFLFLLNIDNYQFGISVSGILLQNKWFTLLTYAFLHNGMSHLIGNVIALLWSGRWLEKQLGNVKFLIFVLISAVYSGLFSVCCSLIKMETEIVTVGLSGIIFSIWSAVIVIMIFEKRKSTSMIIYLIISLMTGFLNPVTDNMGHIGGILIGLCLAAGFILWEHVVSMKLSSRILYLKMRALEGK